MSIYQHFRKEEHAFIDQIISWRDQVKSEYRYKLLDFLNPREKTIVQSVIGTKDEVKCAFWGGYEEAERKRAILYPDYYEPSADDYELVLFKVNYPAKFIQLEHRQVLGALMGLGLKRSKFGDIIINGSNVQFIAAAQIADYIKLNFNQVGKTHITLEEILFDELTLSEQKGYEQTITVSSMRLDTILAEIFHLSRQKVLPYIKNQLVTVNWKIIEDPAYLCHEGDVISIRGFGRSKINKIDGMTKKEKWRLIVEKRK
ncbi:YlmH family RNA-binding protein [Calidifontibacillus erzurumensis]|uniref:RNA-binding protein n=1 Tax=Calidifontibacillus erzurumensis TaxID=2741433 RepID=A0A8J8GFB7_9BACI|nr:RNA-binding protein [Calidifontibacillus erzurumensis]NSL51260.1 RNA-binding protein [Calidifontibacillus erzurumensis]